MTTETASRPQHPAKCRSVAVGHGLVPHGASDGRNPACVSQRNSGQRPPEPPPTAVRLLVSNHVSHLDVFILGIPLHRPLNYVARSTLFLPILGTLIRSVGGFPIQRDGMGAQGLKETLRRIKKGGIVVLFPEGTRSPNGDLGELKSGISVLAARAHVPIIPAGIAGTFEHLAARRAFPCPPDPDPYGPPIFPEDLEGLDTEAVTQLIRTAYSRLPGRGTIRLAT